MGSERHLAIVVLSAALTVAMGGNAAVFTVGFAIGASYPNPLSGSPHITYAIPKSGQIRLVVYDSLGQWVAQRDESWLLAPGRHRIDFTRSALAAGIYFCELQFTRLAGKRLRWTGKFAVSP